MIEKEIIDFLNKLNVITQVDNTDEDVCLTFDFSSNENIDLIKQLLQTQLEACSESAVNYVAGFECATFGMIRGLRNACLNATEERLC